MSKSYKLFLISSLVAVSAGCGGDSGPRNTAPTLTLSSSFSVQEGSVFVGTARGADAQTTAITYSLSGADAVFFAINGVGAISFKSAPDFEAPSDSNADNQYSISVTVSDGSLTSDPMTSTVTVEDAFEGRVVDGPMFEALVFVDLDGDAVQDPDEPSGATDSDGFFFVDTFTTVSGVQARIISVGGTDTATNNPIPALALIADVPMDPVLTALVTPLSTVLSSADTEEKKAAVLSALGITSSAESVLTTDNWALAESGDETAQSVQAVNQQLGLVLQTAGTLIESDTSTAEVSSAAVAMAVAEKVVGIASTSSRVDLSSADTVSAVLTDAVQSADSAATVSTEAIAAVAGSVAEVNVLVGSAGLDPTSTEVAAIVETAQSTLQSAAAGVASGATDVSEFTEKNSTAELFQGSSALASAPDFDSDGIADIADLDDDNDGVDDSSDAFPQNPDETLDTDSDGIGNNADTDDDGDGVLDTADAFPLDESETADTDLDGIGNNVDTDDDGDGVSDILDAFPLDPGESVDTDSDGVGNNADADDDNDGVDDIFDFFPQIALGNRLDTDNDGLPNVCNGECLAAGMIADDDDDGDGVKDVSDRYPLISVAGRLDTDSDGVPNDCDEVCIKAGMVADADDDGDGIIDTEDMAPLDESRPAPLFWDVGRWGEVKWQ